MVSKNLISHLGIAVKDIDDAMARYALITGDGHPEMEEVVDQKVRVAMFGGSSGRIELLAATDSSSPVARFIERHGEGLHHVCIYVDDLESKLAELKVAGIKLIDESPRMGAGGKKIAFVHPSQFNSVLIELEQR